MRILPFLLFGLTGLLFAIPSPAAPAAVPSSQAQCFQIQYLLRLSNLESLRFVRGVAALRAMAPEDPAIADRVGELSRQSVALRREEAGAFAHVSRLFKLMGAPLPLRSWSEGMSSSLSGLVQMTSDERKTAAAQPDTAAVLATLDECDRLEADTDDHMETLGLWINLTYHQRGLWAADVGETTAALHEAVTEGVPPHLSATLGRHLAATAPSDTPPSVQNALSSLSPQAGNLSDLAPATTTDVPLPQAAQAQDTLLAAFSAQALTSQPLAVSP